MENKLARIRQVAKSNGWSLKYRHVERNNMYVFSFFNNDYLDGFSFSVQIHDSDNENIFYGNVAKSIFDTWQNFSVENETEKYLEKIGCKSRFSAKANKIYMQVNYYIYNIYCMFFSLQNK